MGTPVEHALVIGGGVGGLLAAHALARGFRHVTVLERDRYPRDPDPGAAPGRPGAPQGRCPHLLLGAGVEAFDVLVPGWREDVVELGAVPFDACADTALRLPHGWMPRAPSDITSYACSRDLLERVLRGRLARSAGTCVRERRRVVGLVGDRHGRRVTGVRVTGGDAPAEVTLPAALVVDASGRGSALPSWIARIGGRERRPLEETVVEPERHFVSRWFHVPPEQAPDWHLLSVAPPADGHGRSAMMLRAEGERWGVVLIDGVDRPLPLGDAAFLAFTEDLAEGRLRDVLARAHPISPIHRHGPAPSRWRHYECLDAWPDGLVALGDSACALDPYHGLGMTVAALGAALLADGLDARGGAVRPGFQKALAEVQRPPWELASGRTPDGAPLPEGHAGPARVLRAAAADPHVAHALLAVQHMLRPPSTLSELVA